MDNVTTDYPVYNDDDDDDIIIYDMHKSSISKIMFSYDWKIEKHDNKLTDCLFTSDKWLLCVVVDLHYTFVKIIAEGLKC